VAAGREDCWAGTVRDASCGGLGLRARRWFPAGGLLILELWDAAEHSPRLLLVRVKRAAALGGGAWWLGCQLLVRLSYDGVRELRRGR
jgi:hypothetical protein